MVTERNDNTYRMRIAEMVEIGSGSLPAGVNGGRTACRFMYDPNTLWIYCVMAGIGFCRSLLPVCGDAAEARWYLANHPTSRKYYRLEVA